MKCYSFDPAPHVDYKQTLIGATIGLHISATHGGIIRFQFGSNDGKELQIVVELTKEESDSAADFLSRHNAFTA